MSHLTVLVNRYDRCQRGRHIINMIEYFLLPPYGETLSADEILESERCIRDYDDDRLLKIWEGRDETRADEVECVRVIVELGEYLSSIEQREHEEPQERLRLRLG